ncbi:MAG: sensor histidine kinase [Lentisphaeria bacterium]|nr:ATP-binding protein [Lentisphaeria bacterium]NQZ66781.1 sensor histidine kinase [Lentisphaeria bacterium]
MTIEIHKAEEFPLHNPNPVFQVDLAGKLIFANPAANELLSHGQLNATNRITGKLLDLCKESQKVGTLLEQEHNFQGRFYSISAVTLESTVNVYVHDITEQKLSNRKIMDQHAQLIQSEKLASLGQLAAGIAHEINNPVGYISSNLVTMGEYFSTLKRILLLHQKNLETTDSSEQLNCINEIERLSDEEGLDFILGDLETIVSESHNGALLVSEIIMSLRDFARTDDADKTVFDINEGVKSTLKIVWNQLKYKCRIEENYGELPLFDCYPGELNQVFLNILVNASQAIESDGLIKISTSLEDGDKAIIISFSDNGCGIEEEDLEKLFDPFYTTKSVGEGTGLGLYISYSLIKESYGGSIQVKSTYGKGSEFIIRLPIGE